MRCLAPPECLAWARERGVRLEDTLSGFSGGAAAESFWFRIPAEARVQLALSQALVEGMGDVSGSLLWITDWPLCKAHEMAIVTKIRAGFGELRALIDAPGHVVESDDRDLLAGLFALIEAFGWDGYLVTPEAKTIVFASHHDVLQIFTVNEKYSTTVREVARRFRLEAT